MTLQTQFRNLLKDIEPSVTTKNRAQAAHTSMRSFLKEHDEFNMYHVRTFLSGSYKRDTAIRPRTKNGDEERPDVDIIVVTNHTLSDSPAEVVNLLYSSISDGYDEIRLQSRSIGVFTSTADMDVVPVIECSNFDGSVTVYIPDRKLEQWLVTNPPQHTQWTTDVNKASNGRFKPLVKLMKWWRRESPTLYRKPKGFVIECIVEQCMNAEEDQWGELFVGTLEQIVAGYQWCINTQQLPYIEDPGVPTNSVTAGMEFSEFKAFYNKAKKHASLGRQAINLHLEDPDKALKLWRKIFGTRFPAPASLQKATSLLEEAIVPSSLTFPDRPVIPKKPGGFA